MISLDLPFPPSMNHYWRRVGAKTLISRAGRAFRLNVEAAVMAAGMPRVDGRVCVVVDAYPPDRRRRDLDNLFKSLLDAITHAGVIEDDSLIDELTIRRCPVVADGAVVVTVTEIGEVKPCA